MGNWMRRQGPTFVVACLALLVALGGSVYAAARIDGHSVKPGSLPGNRVERGSLTGSRLAPGTLRGGRIAPGSLTGLQVNSATLGKVPEAAQADIAASARTANTARSADRAAEAERLNGHAAGCTTSQRLYAGACWDLGASPAATAPAAAVDCANRGGDLPDALALAAFSGLRGILLSAEGEWTGEIAIYSGPGSYAIATVKPTGEIVSAVSGATRPYRCVIPLVT
jgi:hypothetical protein